MVHLLALRRAQLHDLVERRGCSYDVARERRGYSHHATAGAPSQLMLERRRRLSVRGFAQGAMRSVMVSLWKEMCSRRVNQPPVFLAICAAWLV